jgi:5-methylcytosine-specific restriction endonuclease McrA
MTSQAARKPSRAFRLSPAVKRLGYSGSPLLLDEWLKLQAITASLSTADGKKRLALPPVMLSCGTCGKAFQRQSCEFRKDLVHGHKEFYCSTLCMGRGHNLRRFGERLCVRCGGSAPKASSLGTARRGRIFCSEACLNAERQEELEQRYLARLRPCEYCNRLFPPLDANSRFCSMPCKNKAHAAAMLGRQNPRWMDGATAERIAPHNQKRYREMRPLVLRRDGEKCVLCAKASHLDVHHINENPADNRASNLVTLCRSCHQKAHWESDAIMSSQLKAYAEIPLSMTSRSKATTASSLKAS